MREEAEELLWRGPSLVLDSATAVLHAGILREGEWAAIEAQPGEALETLFNAVKTVLEETRLTLPELRAVALGIGPGSILGLRLALMALRTWQALPTLQHWRLYQFSGLRLQAQQLARAQPDAAFHLISDFRRGHWHHVAVKDGAVGELDLLDDASLEALSGKISYIPTGRGSQSPPLAAETTSFTLAPLPSLRPTSWATVTDQPALYLPAPPTFKKWTARIHGR